MNPRTLAAQLHGGGIQGFGVALGQKWVYDRRWGLHMAKRFYSNRPPTMLDVPHDAEMQWVAANEADPFNPVGARGIGEPSARGRGRGGVVRHRRRTGRGVFQPVADHDRHDPEPHRWVAGGGLEADGTRLIAICSEGETNHGRDTRHDGGISTVPAWQHGRCAGAARAVW